MAILSKAEILGAVDIRTEDVPVPEWGGTVRVSLMSGLARDKLLERAGTGSIPVSQYQASILVATVVSEDGQALFDADDVELLRRKSKLALDRVFDAAMRLNALGDEAKDDAEKNSEAAQSGDSGSASLSGSDAP